jgi:hypothetical protein
LQADNDDFAAFSNISVTNHIGSRTSEVDEFLRKPVKNVKDPLKWWVANRHVYPNLYRMALDYLSIPGALFIYSHSSHATNLPRIATLTAVKRVFSRGCQLLSFTRNRLSASSIRAYLCLGSWGSHDLILFEDIMSAVRGNSKRKWEDSDSDVEVIE